SRRSRRSDSRPATSAGCCATSMCPTRPLELRAHLEQAKMERRGRGIRPGNTDPESGVAMQKCPGSGRELTGDPPPATAATCPVCGRAIQVDPEETDHGLMFTVAPHEQVGQDIG
ncbi:hypothetical protein, partial [Mycobacterium sp. NAZ190054]|uniref:hypothetical protein n=1 Tax=Mycobacterium sp. NAZ190054 TaxID=1747766 RepID=UPI001E629721